MGEDVTDIISAIAKNDVFPLVVSAICIVIIVYQFFRKRND